MPISMTPEDKSLAAIRKVLEETPREEMESIIAEIDALNLQGPTIYEYLEMAGFNMSERLFEALKNDVWREHNLYDVYTMDGKPELWKIAYYPMFEDSKTGKEFGEPRALVERPFEDKKTGEIIGTDFREMPLRYLVKKIAFPNSEHHTSNYRVDLGYFTTSNGNEYQLGMTDTSFKEINGYDCDYTIVGEEGGSYSSGRLDTIFIYKNKSEKYPKNGDTPKHELLKRAISKGLLDINCIKPIWIDDENGVGSDDYLGEEFSTFEEIKKWLSGK